MMFLNLFNNHSIILFHKSSDVIHSAAVTKKELPDKFDRQQWKIMQLAMTDSIKFVDMLHNVPWEDGLPRETREGATFVVH